MKRLAALFALMHMFLLPAAVLAQDYAGTRTVLTTTWVEEWDPATQSWVRVAGSETTTARETAAGEADFGATAQPVPASHHAARYAVPQPVYAGTKAIAEYGPFRVLDEKRAALMGATGLGSPAHFDAMMRDFPALEVLEMVEAPGTNNDVANLAVGRRIRAAGLRTHVPDGGSVRSGAVELFLAGAEQTMDRGAQFAVHSWLDNYGRQPDDFAPDAPENRLYLDYYVEMGMSEERAREFYAMTNSVPHQSALWLRANDMAPWIAGEPASRQVPEFAQPEIRIAELNLLTIPVMPLELPSMEMTPQPVALATIELSNRPMIAYADLDAITLGWVDISETRLS